MEDKRTQLNDSLVKSAAWTHNTSVNKLAYAPLQLVTGKACNLPGLKLGNKATESVSDTEAVQKVMERLLKTQEEFWKAEMRLKLKDCQGVRVKEYQHWDRYVEDDKLWYQHQDSNHWLGPAEVLYHKENKVWVYSNGNVQKVVAIKVKPYELVPREDDEVKEDKNEENKNKNVNEAEMISNDQIDEWEETENEKRKRYSWCKSYEE